MASFTSLRGLTAPRALAPSTTPSLLTRLFTTTTQCLARAAKPVVKSGGKAPKRRSKGGPQRSEHWSRVRMLRRNLFIPAPPPLRMARLRHLRHWTIHRAWLLLRRQQMEATERERERISWGMFNACEELRRTSGPGAKDEGYLYRVAMEKREVWELDSIPIEYARLQTETPAKKAWNHEWKR